MFVAQLFDSVDEAGEPCFSPGREIIEDAGERSRTADFLRSGKIIETFRGFGFDRVTGAPERVVPLHTRTDGTWIWRESMAYYVDVHGIAPESAFRRHMVDQGYRAQEPDEAQWRAALGFLREHRLKKASPRSSGNG